MLNRNFCRTPLEIYFVNLTGKHLCWSLFLIKLQAFGPATLLKRAPTQVLFYEICKIFKNTFFYRTPFYSGCFCVFWKSGENFSPQQLRKSHVGRQQLYRELHCRHSRGNFLKLIKQHPQLFLLLLWALWNFELYYICAALSIIVK